MTKNEEFFLNGKYDFTLAEKEIGYLPYDSIPALHMRVDMYFIKLLDEIREK